MKTKIVVFLLALTLFIPTSRSLPIDQDIESNRDPSSKTYMPWEQNIDEAQDSSFKIRTPNSHKVHKHNKTTKVPKIPSKGCVIVAYSTSIVDRYIADYLLIKNFYKQHPGKQYITPEEFKSLHGNQLNEIMNSHEFHKLRGKFDRFIKTYKGENFVLKFNSNNYFISDDTIKIFKEDFQGILLTPVKCKVVDIAKIAVVALLGEQAYDSILQAEQGMYVYFNSGDDWNFSPL